MSDCGRGRFLGLPSLEGELPSNEIHDLFMTGAVVCTPIHDIHDGVTLIISAWYLPK